MKYSEDFPDSTSINYARYDDVTGVLEISFRKTGAYIYYGVPISVFQELVSTESKGRFVAKNIAVIYRYEKI